MSLSKPQHLELLKELVSCSVCGSILHQDFFTCKCYHNLCPEDKQAHTGRDEEENEGVRCPECAIFTKFSEKNEKDRKSMQTLVDHYIAVAENGSDFDFCKAPKVDRCGLCEKHQLKLEYCCEDHNALACDKCFLKQHRKCDIVHDIDEAIAEYRPSIEKKTGVVETRIQEEKQAIENHQNQSVAIRKRAEDIREEMEAKCNEGINALKKDLELKLKSLEVNTDERQARIDKACKVMEHNVASSERLLSVTRHIFDVTEGASLWIQIKDHLGPSLQAVIDTPVNMPPLDKGETKFDPAKSLKSHKSLLGELIFPESSALSENTQ